jgi:hypothetical protein
MGIAIFRSSSMWGDKRHHPFSDSVRYDNVTLIPLVFQWGLYLISIKDQKYNFRHQDKAVLPRVRTTRYGLNSFRYNAAQIWNELPNHFRQETSLEHFKNIIHTWNGSSCQCKKQFSNTKSIVKVETCIVTLISYHHYLEIVGNNKLWSHMQLGKVSWNIHVMDRAYPYMDLNAKYGKLLLRCLRQSIQIRIFPNWGECTWNSNL